MKNQMQGTDLLLDLQNGAETVNCRALTQTENKKKIKKK
jgi:hypothetical protein